MVIDIFEFQTITCISCIFPYWCTIGNLLNIRFPSLEIITLYIIYTKTIIQSKFTISLLRSSKYTLKTCWRVIERHRDAIGYFCKMEVLYKVCTLWVEILFPRDTTVYVRRDIVASSIYL